MRRSSLLLALASCCVVTFSPSLAAPAFAAGATGGASADAASGGPHDTGALTYGAPTRQQPVARVFGVVPGSVVEGGAIRLRLRVVERGVDRVSVRVAAIDRNSGRVGANVRLGVIRTGRTVTVAWPAAERPPAGDYVVRLHVRDPQGATLARAGAATGKSRLIVRRRPRPEKPQPTPQAEPTPAAPAGGIFPVAGPYTWGGGDGTFGAGRAGHVHEGQDLPAAEGTPVVAPVPGTVAFTDSQPSGAGFYVVLNADDGRAMFFAHCQAGSFSVAPGQRVVAGQGLCRVGSTGASTGPHLHFELWLGGWRDRGGTVVDPLPQLRAWAGLG